MLIFIGLDSADLSRGRVMERVEAGGHDVPDEKIETRFPRTFTNLRQALSFVNQALLFDNSSADEPFRFVAEFRDGKRRRRKGSVRRGLPFSRDWSRRGLYSAGVASRPGRGSLARGAGAAEHHITERGPLREERGVDEQRIRRRHAGSCGAATPFFGSFTPPATATSNQSPAAYTPNDPRERALS